MSSQKKKKGSAKFMDPLQKTTDEEEQELSALRADIEQEQQKKDAIEWGNAELEKSVRRMEGNKWAIKTLLAKWKL